MRSYSQLDRASLQSTDITEGLDSTLVMLGHKLGGGRHRRARLRPDVPAVEAMPAELNQVWTNLIDNAVDAMDGPGRCGSGPGSTSSAGWSSRSRTPGRA